MKEPTQFQFDCKISLLALRDYLSKVNYDEWREDMKWTNEFNYVDSWAEHQWSELKRAPFWWFVEVCEESQFKFLASVEKRVR